jgi:glutaredoxin
MFENFRKYLTCENIINLILIVIIIILLVNIIYQKFFSKSGSETLTNVSESVKEKFKNGKIVVYKTNSCGYCRKFMKLLHDLGLETYARVVDVGTQNGKTEYAALRENGVPIIKCETTGEIHVGYNGDIEDLLHKLKM